jgi:hypothetical protein
VARQFAAGASSSSASVVFKIKSLSGTQRAAVGVFGLTASLLMAFVYVWNLVFPKAPWGTMQVWGVNPHPNASNLFWRKVKKLICFGFFKLPGCPRGEYPLNPPKPLSPESNTIQPSPVAICSIGWPPATAPIDQLSYFPHEEELLYAPGALLRTQQLYALEELSIRHGQPPLKESTVDINFLQVRPLFFIITCPHGCSTGIMRDVTSRFITYPPPNCPPPPVVGHWTTLFGPTRV